MSIYSDLNRKDAKTRSRVTDLEAVLNAFYNSLKQPPKQRLFRPEGSSFDQLLFTVDPDMTFRIKNLLFRAVERDPRLILVYNESLVTADPDTHTWTIVARLQVKGFENQTFTRIGTIRG